MCCTGDEDEEDEDEEDDLRSGMKRGVDEEDEDEEVRNTSSSFIFFIQLLRVSNLLNYI